jgi:hypothetical protein
VATWSRFSPKATDPAVRRVDTLGQGATSKGRPEWEQAAAPATDKWSLLAAYSFRATRSCLPVGGVSYGPPKGPDGKGKNPPKACGSPKSVPFFLALGAQTQAAQVFLVLSKRKFCLTFLSDAD